MYCLAIKASRGDLTAVGFVAYKSVSPCAICLVIARKLFLPQPCWELCANTVRTYIVVYFYRFCFIICQVDGNFDC